MKTEYTPKEPRSADAEPAMQDCPRRLFLFAPARSALRCSAVTERTKLLTAKPVLATNTDNQKDPMGTDLNANL